jgi:hypothetical protein
MAGSSQGNADSGPVDGIGGEINDTGVAKLVRPHGLSDDRSTRDSRLKQLLIQCMETAGCTGEIDPSGVELKECGDEVFSSTGY